jgi:hypothetical protein
MSMTVDVDFAELRPTLAENNLRLSQDGFAPVKLVHHVVKNTEMVIGPWYLDEFGNPTREVKARD